VSNDETGTNDASGPGAGDRVEEWRSRAAAVRAQYWRGTSKSGTGPPSNPMAELAPEFAQLMADISFGETYANPRLDLKTRALCTVSALVALGEEAYAANWIGNALRAGATPEEVVELLRQLFFYLGSTRTLRGFAAAKAAFEEHRDRGVGDVLPP
jgi:4-carboxymuconolactone decarboxylase